METHAMSLIRSGYPAARRWGLLAVLFSALLALSLFHPSVAAAQEVKQIKLTEKHMQGFIVVSEHMAQLYHGANPDRPDPTLEGQAEALVKKNGFASLAEYDDVSTNIAIVLSGIDRQTKTFTEPPDQIKKEINSIKANKAIPEAQKKEDVAQLETALKDARPIQFKENIAMVLKYFDNFRRSSRRRDLRISIARMRTVVTVPDIACHPPGARALLDRHRHDED
jgi:hypothetical protein